jgi:3-oxoacyl-[acyl-carrier protein] reductase
VPQAVEAARQLDILVNNAVTATIYHAMKTRVVDVIRVNLRPPFACPRRVPKPMMRAPVRRIISITSVSAHRQSGQANYAASKAGLVGMSKAMAQEVASRGITVNCIAPGFIRSAMTEALPDTQKAALLGRIPAGDLGAGEDVAAAAVYLASREAGYVTGQTLHVNGGMAMI